MGAAGDLLPDRFHDTGMAVTEDQGAVTHHVVDVLVSVDIMLHRAAGIGDENGKWRVSRHNVNNIIKGRENDVQLIPDDVVVVPKSTF